MFSSLASCAILGFFAVSACFVLPVAVVVVYRGRQRAIGPLVYVDLIIIVEFVCRGSFATDRHTFAVTAVGYPSYSHSTSCLECSARYSYIVCFSVSLLVLVGACRISASCASHWLVSAGALFFQLQVL